MIEFHRFCIRIKLLNFDDNQIYNIDFFIFIIHSQTYFPFQN